MSATAPSAPDLDPFKIGTYFNNKIQDAIDWAADNGPCTVLLPPGYYTKDQSLTLHGQVTLGGLNCGNFDIDTCQYGIIAKSTDPVGGGFTFSNGNMGCYQPLAKCGVITLPGGLQEPLIAWQGGAIRGQWPISNQMAGKITTTSIVGHDI